MKMKKYLITAALAIAIGGVFVSCKDDEFSDSLIEQKAKAFEEAFIDAFGTPVPNHTWGFRDNVTTRTFTRTADPGNYGEWFGPNQAQQYKDMGLVAPEMVSAEEEEFVANWFKTNKDPQSDRIELSTFFVQQVYFGTKVYTGYDGNGAKHEVVGGQHMDWLCAYDPVGKTEIIYPDWNNYQATEVTNHDDHMYNFNTSAPLRFWTEDGTYNVRDYMGAMQLMVNSSTSRFGCKESQGTDNKVYYNFVLKELTFNGKVGYYVGFDYENHGQNGDFPKDGYYDDRIIKIVPGEGYTSSEEWEEIVTREEIIDAGRVFCEDLGASNRSDIDYNDIVFDAVIVHETKKLVTSSGSEENLSDKYYAKVCLLAAGGTIPATVGGHEIHNLFECSTNVMINTTKDPSKVNGAGIGEHAPVIIDRIDDVKTIDGIKIFALYNDKLIEVTNNKNLAAYKICVPIGTRWAKERVNIGIAYKSFAEYCNKDPNIEFWNKETNKVTNDSLWNDSATPSPFEGERYKVGKVTYNYETKKIIWRNAVNNAISWSSSNNFYRFALKDKDPNKECLAEFPKKAWDIIKSGTFYLTFQPTEEWYQIRITNGWWDTQWMGAENDFSPSNMADRIIDNGDDTYTIEINFGNDPIVNDLDKKHLLLTGTGYRPLKLYYIE